MRDELRCSLSINSRASFQFFNKLSERWLRNYLPYFFFSQTFLTTPLLSLEYSPLLKAPKLSLLARTSKNKQINYF